MTYRSYIQGRLALAGVDLHAPVATWLDAVWAVYVDAPHQLLEKMAKERVVRAAQLRPDRETWGKLPEQRALGAGLVQEDGSAADYGKPGTPLPPELQGRLKRR
jgi:hypothetical protein